MGLVNKPNKLSFTQDMQKYSKITTQKFVFQKRLVKISYVKKIPKNDWLHLFDWFHLLKKLLRLVDVQ